MRLEAAALAGRAGTLGPTALPRLCLLKRVSRWLVRSLVPHDWGGGQLPL